MKHKFYISKNKIKLEGVWAWIFIIQITMWFIIAVFDIVRLFI